MHLISYDIESDHIRVKAAKALLRYGLIRVQYSVFMGEVKESALAKVKKELQDLAASPQWSDDDTVMILPLHQYSEDYIEFVGRSPDRWAEITGELHTLMF